jgi:urease accessory protein
MSRNSNPGESSSAGELAQLRLLHLADSALPIGSLAHSFGIETLVSCEILSVSSLPDFLRGYLQEAGFLEAAALREAFPLAAQDSTEFPAARWIALNDLLSALKAARESRAASATLGRNFLRAVIEVTSEPLLLRAWQCSMEAESSIHQSTAFGLAGAVLGFDENSMVLAFLHQMSANLVSACQRLMPLGQAEAMRILWNLKPAMSETAERSAQCPLEAAHCTMPLLDWGGMEHPALRTRLFVS